MADENDNFSGEELGDEQLDALLAEARWPQMPQLALGRAAHVLEDHHRSALASSRRVSVWLYAGATIAAALALAITLWAVLSRESARDAIAENPEQPQPLQPLETELAQKNDRQRLTYAVLPGRDATEVEIAWVEVVRRERQKAQGEVETSESPAPVQAEPRPHPDENRVAPARIPRALIARNPRPLPPSDAQLLATLLDLAADTTQRAAAAEQVSAAAIERALAQPRLSGRASELLWALTLSRDPAAAHVLLRAAERDSEGARQAIAAAPASAPAVQSLLRLLEDPVVPRREAAASLLAASRDPAVYDALASRLAAAVSRREALIALLSSDAPRAQTYVARAETDSRLKAIVRSLRTQGIGRRQPPQPVIL